MLIMAVYINVYIGILVNADRIIDVDFVEVDNIPVPGSKNVHWLMSPFGLAIWHWNRYGPEVDKSNAETSAGIIESIEWRVTAGFSNHQDNRTKLLCSLGGSIVLQVNGGHS